MAKTEYHWINEEAGMEWKHTAKTESRTPWKFARLKLHEDWNNGMHETNENKTKRKHTQFEQLLTQQWKAKKPTDTKRKFTVTRWGKRRTKQVKTIQSNNAVQKKNRNEIALGTSTTAVFF